MNATNNANNSAAGTGANGAAGAQGGHSAKIMVVDDDVRLRDLLRRYLTEQGFQVVTAESAPAMNKLWLRERYDLLVLDLMLPGIPTSGYVPIYYSPVRHSPPGCPALPFDLHV
eukprot:TRINITY_DN23605_c0_g1_i1.p1 TRINITY_DN23605_c0_g1~~TRINITY_DN23605_c0_g1_i1.p1  ORF type:complete len:114 (+),score=25.41 TRINITY_DN23605_c0_g1_i1:145-486(+)